MDYAQVLADLSVVEAVGARELAVAAALGLVAGSTGALGAFALAAVGNIGGVPTAVVGGGWGGGRGRGRGRGAQGQAGRRGPRASSEMGSERASVTGQAQVLGCRRRRRRSWGRGGEQVAGVMTEERGRGEGREASMGEGWRRGCARGRGGAASGRGRRAGRWEAGECRRETMRRGGRGGRGVSVGARRTWMRAADGEEQWRQWRQRWWWWGGMKMGRE